MGTNILFPYPKLSNESTTEDWMGNKYFFAELSDVFSTPNIEEEQRVRFSNTNYSCVNFKKKKKKKRQTSKHT